MSVTIRHSVAARNDLVELWLFIAGDDNVAADRQVERLVAATNQLLEYPDLGHARIETGSDLRVLLQDRYLIVYRHIVEDAMIVIERIVHGSRDLAALFD